MFHVEVVPNYNKIRKSNLFRTIIKKYTFSGSLLRVVDYNPELSLSFMNSFPLNFLGQKKKLKKKSHCIYVK